MQNTIYLKLYTDAASPNPGNTGIGFVVYRNEDAIYTLTQNIGIKTNNFGEYTAIIKAVQFINEYYEQLCNTSPETSLEADIFSDSQLAINQIKGIYNISKKDLQYLCDEINILCKKHKNCTIRFNWTNRANNDLADALASLAADMPQGMLVDVNENLKMLVPWDENVVNDNSDVSPSDNVKSLNGNYNYRSLLFLKKIKKFDNNEEIKNAIISQFSEENFLWLLSALEDTEDTQYKNDALYWCACGLPPNIALKKASVEKEKRCRIK